MQLPRAADIFVCFSCAKRWDGYPLTQPLKGGIGFRCFCCDKHCYGVRYQLAEDSGHSESGYPQQAVQLAATETCTTTTTTCTSEEARPEDQSDIPSLGAWLAVLQLDGFLSKAKDWCEEMGAAELDEIRENWEDFAEYLNLSEEERERLAEACQPQQQTPLSPLPATKSRESFGPDDAPYTMLEKLGQGATATVYRCKRGADEYAVKVIDLHRFCLHPEFQKFRQHIRREMSLLLMLQHRNIVKLIDVFESKDTFFLVMELVRGGDLSEYLLKKPHGRLDDKEACHVFLQIVEGLSHIHSKNIVHRDLKPQNILLVDAAPEPSSQLKATASQVEVKLSDFGHSKLVRDGYTYARSHVGTPQYLAPEVLLPNSVTPDVCSSQGSYDERADVWSLGVILFVMLTGHYPFRSSEDPLFWEGRFSFRGSGRAEELLRGLIKKRPEERLSLEQCLKSAWVLDNSRKAPPSPQRQLTKNLQELRIRLPQPPKNVSEFKTELDSFSLKHKVSASLQLLEVVVAFCVEDPGSPLDAVWSELWELLRQSCPELKWSRSLFPECKSWSLDGPADPKLEEEQEALEAIYSSDFEALSSWSWLVHVGCGTALRVELPAGYPASSPPCVWVECPHGKAPQGIQASLEACWTGSECVYDMVECLRAAVLAAQTGEDPLGPDVSKPAEADEAPVRSEPKLPILHGEILIDRKSSFQAHLAVVSSMQEVDSVRDALLQDRKILQATHNVAAWRFRYTDPAVVEDFADDGEAGAGRRLLAVLKKRKDMDIVVIVTRWRGIIHLGVDRFRNYCKAAVQLLERDDRGRQGSKKRGQ
ncbi:CPK1 [Symbiodinium natans]|uniref:CPK1 protein n=1 Tax=Symbiodinium natans TaxID=878477 RepID=A0A812SNL7_9DINO|nr:CPK1 [Symbiodinium natans]